MTRGWKIAIGVAAALIAANLGLHELDRLTRSPGGPSSSSFATAPGGVAAYAELLGRFDRPVVRLRETPADARLDPAATLVVLDARGLTRADGEAVGRFLRAGGRLVAGGRPGGWLEAAVPGAPEWDSDGTETARGAFGSARRVRTAGRGAWTTPGGLLRSREGALLVRRAVGAGAAFLLADSSPLQNRLLGEADNAALGLALAGERPVAFTESVHGFGPMTGLEAVPARWWWVFGGLLLAAATLALARGRRLGPPEREHRALPPARAEFAEALATLLAKGRPRAAGVEATRRLVRQRLRLPEDAPAEDVRAAAAARGLDPSEAAALLGGAGDAELLALGRALRRLEREEAIAA